MMMMVGGGARGLEGGHPDDVGLGVVWGGGGAVVLGRGDGRHGQRDDGRRDVGLLAVQRHRLLKLSVQTGATGDEVGGKREEEEEVR